MYLENQRQTTTGNVYGIYDTLGGQFEYVAIFNNTDNSNRLSSWTSGTGLTTKSNSTKYATKYNNNTTEEYEAKTIYKFGKTGDASKEVHLGKNSQSWFKDFASIVNGDAPLMRRGANNATNSEHGTFFSNAGIGQEQYNSSFRVVLIP